MAETLQKQGMMIYQGLEGLKEIFDKILTENTGEYLVIALGKELAQKKLIDFFMNFHKKRVRKNIKVRLIADASSQKTIENYPPRGMIVKYSNVKLPKGTFIFGDNVMSIIWDETPTAFVLTSKKNAQKYKDFFEEIWRFALNP